jgi:hypothetical protein
MERLAQPLEERISRPPGLGHQWRAGVQVGQFRFRPLAEEYLFLWIDPIYDKRPGGDSGTDDRAWRQRQGEPKVLGGLCPQAKKKRPPTRTSMISKSDHAFLVLDRVRNPIIDIFFFMNGNANLPVRASIALKPPG